MKIAIIDYEVGNLANVYNACQRLGVDGVITRDKKIVQNADVILLPGVGAIRDAVANLKKFDLVSLLRSEAAKGKFILGICLGMQALYERSYEGGIYECLGLLPGEIVEFKTKLKVPHMGWNELEFQQDHWINRDLPEHPYVYFVHSYYKSPTDTADVIAVAQYGQPVPAIVGKDNVLGMQFHPEKSGTVGAQLLKNVVDYIAKEDHLS